MIYRVNLKDTRERKNEKASLASCLSILGFNPTFDHVDYSLNYLR